MKNLLIILVFLSVNAYSQNIGDRLSYLLENKEELNITRYKFNDNYLELVSINDSITTLYFVGFKPQKIFSIHYIYLDTDNQSRGLKSVIHDAVSIGNGVWMNNNKLITVREHEIIITDVRRAKRIFRNRKL